MTTVQLVSEYRKLRTSRLWRLVLAAMVAVVAALTAMFSFGAVSAPATNVDFSSAASVAVLYNLTAALGTVFPLALGVMCVTREHHHRTATITFLGEPHRGRVFWSKVTVCAGAAAVLGTVTLLACTAVVSGILTLNDQSAYLSSPEVLRRLVGAWVVVVLWAVIGVGLGAVVKNQVVAIAGILVFTQLVEPVLKVASTYSPFPGVSTFLPGGASDALAGGTVITMAMEIPAGGQLQGALVLGAYAAILLVWGDRMTRRRDVL